MKSTVRILVDWQCNLHCWYCCNEQERFRREIQPTTLDEIDFSRYGNVCISGGEPLLFLDKVADVCSRALDHQLVILYTNGILLTKQVALRLEKMGVDCINIGLHIPKTFQNIISRVQEAVAGTSLKVRFQANETEKWIADRFPEAQFKFWMMDDCERENEDRFVLS